MILLFVVSVGFCGVQLKRFDSRYGVYPFVVNQLKMSSYDFIGDNYFVPSEKEITFPFKRDLVIVLAESFETSFFDKNISSESIPDGRMMRARSEGLFTNNMQQIRGTGWTIASMTAWHFGLPLKLPSFVEGNN